MSFNAQKSKCSVVLPRSFRSLARRHRCCVIVIFVLAGCSPDIINRQCSFIGQVNSVLWFFGKLSSEVKIRLFRSYCTSFSGCELWNLSCAQLADLCTKWWKSVQRVLNLPLQTHCYLLPLLCQCLPVYDEICGRTINFVRSCLYHQSSLVSWNLSHGTAFYTVVTAPLWGAMYYSVCNAINVLLMTFYHVTRSSMSFCVCWLYR